MEKKHKQEILKLNDRIKDISTELAAEKKKVSKQKELRDSDLSDFEASLATVTNSTNMHSGHQSGPADTPGRMTASELMNDNSNTNPKKQHDPPDYCTKSQFALSYNALRNALAKGTDPSKCTAEHNMISRVIDKYLRPFISSYTGNGGFNCGMCGDVLGKYNGVHSDGSGTCTTCRYIPDCDACKKYNLGGPKFQTVYGQFPHKHKPNKCPFMNMSNLKKFMDFVFDEPEEVSVPEDDIVYDDKDGMSVIDLNDLLETGN